MSGLLAWFVQTLASAYAVYTLAGLGSAIVERSGVLNLAIDGMFVLSSSLAYTYAMLFSLAFQAGPLATGASLALTAVTLALLYGAFTVANSVLPVNQGAIGLSFMFVGYGLGAVVGNVGRIMFSRGARVEYIGITHASVALAYAAVILLAIAAHLLLYKYKLGVLIRAVGENPRLASQAGVNVAYVRLLAGALGGALVGLGGALFTLWRVGGWSQGQGLNHGWLAYAVSVAGLRRPLLIAVASVFFSAAYVLLPYLQSLGLPVEASAAAPYITSIALMAIISVVHKRGRLAAAPRSLGVSFYMEEQV